MKYFYIETDKLLQEIRLLRYTYSEDEFGKILLIKIEDCKTNEEVLLKDIERKIGKTVFANIQTAYLGNYKRTPIE